MSKPKLISFKICPFVQRNVILLKEKGVDFDVEFIDVNDPPDWFRKISPTGKVPVLLVDDTPLFESTVISEYLDEVYPPSMHPADPLKKAQNRAWMEYTSPMNMSFFNLIMAKNREEGEKARDELRSQLEALDKVADQSPWFNGDAFSVMDATAAPIFTRLAFLNRQFGIDLLEKLPNLSRWSDHLLDRTSVKESVVDDFETILLGRIKAGDSWLVEQR